MLARYGVTTTYYDPLIGGGIAALIAPNTRAVFCEAPGSLTFEMQDIPAIAAVAHAQGRAGADGQYLGRPALFPRAGEGRRSVDPSGTKYFGGHSDVMLGTVSANAAAAKALKDYTGLAGLCVGPDDMYLGLRGLRTMGVRLARHQESGLKVARWLRERPEVARVLHPALDSDPGHAIWQRDFTGACGLFSFVLKPMPQKAAYAFLNALTLFGMGASWGGYESLAIPFDVSSFRTATRWAPGGPAIRLHIGLEDVSDLIADLERGFAAMALARKRSRGLSAAKSGSSTASHSLSLTRYSPPTPRSPSTSCRRSSSGRETGSG